MNFVNALDDPTLKEVEIFYNTTDGTLPLNIADLL